MITLCKFYIWLRYKCSRGSRKIIYNNHFINSISLSHHYSHDRNNSHNKIGTSNQPPGKLKHHFKHSTTNHKVKLAFPYAK